MRHQAFVVGNLQRKEDEALHGVPSMVTSIDILHYYFCNFHVNIVSEKLKPPRYLCCVKRVSCNLIIRICFEVKNL